MSLGKPHSASGARVPASYRGPVRTCVGCRQRDRKAALIRVVLRGGLRVAEPGAPGRGAYVHGATCLERAQARGAMSRAFRTHVPNVVALASEVMAHTPVADSRIDWPRTKGSSE